MIGAARVQSSEKDPERGRQNYATCLSSRSHKSKMSLRVQERLLRYCRLIMNNDARNALVDKFVKLQPLTRLRADWEGSTAPERTMHITRHMTSDEGNMYSTFFMRHFVSQAFCILNLQQFPFHMPSLETACGCGI